MEMWAKVLHSWGKPERTPPPCGKRRGGPCVKNHNEKQDRNTPLQIQHGGPCTNKHDKLTDTSIQVHCNAKMFGLIY